MKIHHNILFLIKQLLNYSIIFSKIYYKSSKLLFNKNTDLVIEGFPRSGNTFLTVLIMKLFPSKNIAHHLHIFSQIKFGVKRKLPTYLIIRNPEDAVRSLCIRQPEIWPSTAFFAYAFFYLPSIYYLKYISWIKFEEIIEFDKMKNRLLDDFSLLEKEKYNDITNIGINDQIKIINNEVDRRGIDGLAIPSNKRNEKKQKVDICRVSLSKYFAKKIYNIIIKRF